MHRYAPGLAACAALLLQGGLVRADNAEPLFPPVHLPGPCASPADKACFEPPAVTDGSHESLFSMNLMLGMQTGVRAQAAVIRGDKWELVGEGYLGFLLTHLGPGAGFGVGGRAVWRRSTADGKDCLLLGPGIDLFYQDVLLAHRGGLMAAPSVDVSWLHGTGDRGGWEIGLNIGLGVGLSGQRTWDQPAAGVATPLVSIFSGFRF